MNKTEKLICIVLGAVLAWYLFVQSPKEAKARRETAQTAVQTQEKARPAAAPATPADAAATAPDRAEARTPALPSAPEKTVALENDDMRIELSTWGAAVRSATLKRYAKNVGAVSDGNPPVKMDFSGSPLGAAQGAPVVAYDIVSQDATSAVFRAGSATRRISLADGYRVTFDDEGVSASLSLGTMRMGDSKNDLLSVDSMAVDAGKGKPGVVHHCEGDSPLKAYLVGGLSGGCSGSSSAAGMPRETTVDCPGAATWIAVKNRFFVTALASSSEAVEGFSATVRRDMSSANYRPESVSATVWFAGDGAKRTAVFYIGPKRQSLLWDLGMRDVMEFGMWRWLCYPLVWVLNFFNDLVPNYGVAIILLTILVRLLFWPLTHKSTVGMKKMQEIQPLMKEIQTKYKDNPQRMQQETWALYREKKVNPMSSCLPMLIQIPVFIALFNVLRSAVELRYAPFLWIADLSEPEGLGAGSWFPFFGGLNILPVLMAVTTALQSAFTPSVGDAAQKKMMMIFMPAMMLVMFYSFPSALSLYWFLSNIFSIVQMAVIRRRTAKEQAVLVPEVINPPQTRQMRRHG